MSVTMNVICGLFLSVYAATTVSAVPLKAAPQSRELEMMKWMNDGLENWLYSNGLANTRALTMLMCESPDPLVTVQNVECAMNMIVNNTVPGVTPKEKKEKKKDKDDKATDSWSTFACDSACLSNIRDNIRFYVDQWMYTYGVTNIGDLTAEACQANDGLSTVTAVQGMVDCLVNNKMPTPAPLAPWAAKPAYDWTQWTAGKGKAAAAAPAYDWTIWTTGKGAGAAGPAPAYDWTKWSTGKGAAAAGPAPAYDWSQWVAGKGAGAKGAAPAAAAYDWTQWTTGKGGFGAGGPKWGAGGPGGPPVWAKGA